MSKYLSAVVIPCLNEQHSLISTCKSLGFGAGSWPPTETLLILVDNGSEDATLAIAGEIQKQSPAESVIIATESERGYVPPRRLGNQLAMSTAAKRGFRNENLIIIQADADTVYCDSYIEAISDHALKMGPGVLVDSCSEYPQQFIEEHNPYISLCDEVDREFELLLADQSRDLIIDDKACAYWASDYNLWGGHQREYTSRGDEIHSETARLYIRARTFGAQRSLCEDAIAKHSDRRILADPAFCFATAGFPRESAFKQKWEQLYTGPKNLAAFCSATNRSEITLAIRSRRAHMQGLFKLLTEHVRHAIDPSDLDKPPLDYFNVVLPTRNAQTARDSPGVLIEDVMASVDQLVFDSTSQPNRPGYSTGCAETRACDQ